jgi:hypothetical protein
MSLHLHPHKLDSVEELLLVFSDNVLTAGNRLAMRDLGLDSGQLGHITFQQLFPQLAQTAVNVPLPLTHQRQTYYYRLRAPTRTHVAVPAPAPRRRCRPSSCLSPVSVRGEDGASAECRHCPVY